MQLSVAHASRSTSQREGRNAAFVCTCNPYTRTRKLGLGRRREAGGHVRGEDQKRENETECRQPEVRN